MITQITILDFIPYIILVMICWFYTYHKTKNNSGLKIMFWSMLIFSAIRINVGWDFMSYIDLIENRLDDIQFERIEWLSRWLMLLSRHTNFTQLYFIINAVIGMVCLYKVVARHSIDPNMSLYTFLTFSLFFLMTMNIIRNFTAVLMVMYSCSLFLERRYIKYIIIIILAAGIHSSAYLGFLIPLVYYFQASKKLNIIFFVSSFVLIEFVKLMIISFEYVNPLLGKVLYYIVHGQEDTGGKLYQYIIYLINIIFLMFWNRLVKANPINKFWLNMLNFGVCLWIIFSFQSTLSLRISLFYIVWLIILVPALINVFEINYRKIIKQIIMLGLAALFFLNLYILASAYNEGKIEQASFLPYNVFFLQ